MKRLVVFVGLVIFLGCQPDYRHRSERCYELLNQAEHELIEATIIIDNKDAKIDSLEKALKECQTKEQKPLKREPKDF